MNKRKFIISIGAILLVLMLFTGYIAVATEYGSKDDPVVTLSYINDVFSKTTQNQINNSVSAQVTSYNSTVDSKIVTLKNEINNNISSLVSNNGFVDQVARKVEENGGSQAASWEVVKITNGKTLKMAIGTQVVLRIGTAKCYTSGSIGLINLTAGETLGKDAKLVNNNLYIATIEDRGVTATSNAIVLVLGDYTIA